MFWGMREQLMPVFASVALGMAIGLWYDMFRTLRWQLSCGRGGTALCDIAFWCGTLLALTEFHLVLAPGQSRYYFWLGFALGVLLYCKTLSTAVLWLLSLLWRLGHAARTVMRVTAVRCRDCRAARVAAKKIVAVQKKIKKSTSIFRRKGIK